MSIEVSLNYLEKANIYLGEAKESSKRLDWSHCVLRSAECVEFSLKAVLQVKNVEYKRDHDVSGYLIGSYNQFPEWFKTRVPRFSSLSKVLSSLCLQAKYGNELLKTPPKIIFDRPEAQAYLEIADEIYLDCNKLFLEIKTP
jgi:HEPN domain-containing protein